MKWWVIALTILVLDAVSKGITHFYFHPFESSSHVQWGGIDFCIHYVTNKGVAWGLGGAWQHLILVARIAIVAAIAVYMRKPSSQRYALVLIAAGGLGNILDYFFYGHVVDMFHFTFWGYSYPVFNVADAAIFCGIMALLWKSWKTPGRKDACAKNG